MIKKYTCPTCGNNKKRHMDYVPLWGEELEELHETHFGLRCKKCNHFWEVVKYGK